VLQALLGLVRISRRDQSNPESALRFSQFSPSRNRHKLSAEFRLFEEADNFTPDSNLPAEASLTFQLENVRRHFAPKRVSG
jgi:hypothetical protein